MNSWRVPTTRAQRLEQAMSLLCNGVSPSSRMVDDWIAERNDDLQDFACTHGPSWAQGIAVIDAAQIMADQPTEGVNHK